MCALTQVAEKLADSISVHGLQSAIKVRPKGDRHEIICGRERYLSALKAGLTALPCLVQEMTDQEAMKSMLLENMEREGLSDYEVGRWYKMLM